MKKTIIIARDFNKAPAGRSKKSGDFSGQRFREEFLAPVFKDNSIDEIEIVLNGLDGVGSSFWEEAFGGLIREEKISFKKIEKKLVFKCDDDITLIPAIKSYIKEASKNG